MKVWLAPAVALALLAGVVVERAWTRAVPADTGPYHERIRLAGERVAYQVGPWIGRDVPVPQAAMTMLKPNLIVSRRYSHVETGQAASLLVVHCSDVRDLMGHYPPVCYPGQGWVQKQGQRTQWRVGARTIDGTLYRFGRDDLEQAEALAVGNFMAVHTGRTWPDMQALARFAKDPRKRVYGAAQVQVVMDARMSQEAQNQTIDALLGAVEPLLRAVLREDGND